MAGVQLGPNFKFCERGHLWIDIPRATAALLNPLDPYVLAQWIRPALSNPYNFTLIITGLTGSILTSGGELGRRRLVGTISQPSFLASGIPPMVVPPYTTAYVPEGELPLDLNVFDVPLLLVFLADLRYLSVSIYEQALVSLKLKKTIDAEVC